ncbi:MAG: acetolactate synthase small subunit [Lachnospiraceae bacterium]|nr:acetolactate synthase small subunit [Lachnospiraceae bacterium]
MRKVFSILVSNTSGVLSRVSGLFSRRGYNIKSLTVAETENPEFSRMTVVADGDERILEQIKNQLYKLEDVKDIIELKSREAVCRELMIIKIGATTEQRNNLVAIADIFRAKVVDVSVDTMMLELTGNQDKLDSFIRMLKDYTIIEMVRTGVTGLMRADYEAYRDNV